MVKVAFGLWQQRKDRKKMVGCTLQNVTKRCIRGGKRHHSQKEGKPASAEAEANSKPPVQITQ